MHRAVRLAGSQAASSPSRNRRSAFVMSRDTCIWLVPIIYEQLSNLITRAPAMLHDIRRNQENCLYNRL